MDEPFDRALVRAADGPDPRVDLDEVAAIARRRRRRRRRVLAGVGVALVVAAVPAAVIAAGGLSGDDAVVLAPEEGDTTSPPPADGTEAADTSRGRAAVELELRDQQVPRCGMISLRQHNTGDVGLATGKSMGLQRWTGTAWRGVSPLPPGHAWPLIEISVSPGEASSWQDLDLAALDHVEPGWYRITKTFDVDPDSGSGDPNRDQPSLEVAAVVEVVPDPHLSGGTVAPRQSSSPNARLQTKPAPTSTATTAPTTWNYTPTSVASASWSRPRTAISSQPGSVPPQRISTGWDRGRCQTTGRAWTWPAMVVTRSWCVTKMARWMSSWRWPGTTAISTGCMNAAKTCRDGSWQPARTKTVRSGSVAPTGACAKGQPGS